ncbi:alpha/beta hydrolase-fold protein [Flavobacterium sp. LS1R47]|uniref:Alpha/beta hydrolase-fold protein n=1 Tax=Flavobacterium frigoritolerans TaxID=2987686 RepID=A0A9X3C759_9FLAO|nr:alpha/beta hydrolase-fold protein [Flavobacterium frigoritolerans]MCV9930702.1 alpha/beta hydrolase-fold protein [Flavobacterium frigoritolerans]
MKQLLFSLLFIGFTFFAKAQSDNKITIGTIETVHSKILNEDRKVWIYVPGGYTKGTAKTEHYPVLYLLDGDAHFTSVVGMTEQLSTMNGNTICPKMIVVGILNTDRARDLTPTHIESDLPMMSNEASKTTGGNENFIAFIQKELMPYVETNYPTAPYKMLIGHSFGGLTAINTLANHTNLFNSYVSIDPSMWWDKQKFLEQTKKVFAEKKFKNNTSLFLGIANTMEAGMDTIRVKKDTTQSTRHIRAIFDLANTLKKNKQNQLNFEYKYYDKDSHGSVPFIAEYDALRFIFDFYKLDLTYSDLFDNGMSLPTKVEKHYQNVSEKMGYQILPPESYINMLGYMALGRKNIAQGEYFFKLNIKNYPQSANVYDSMGDYYKQVSDKTNAISNYKKALSINKESAETKQKLEELEKGK